MAASTVTFAKDSTSVVVHGPDSATSAAGTSRWVTGQTVDGTRYSYQTNASTRNQWTLSFRSLTLGQRNNLSSFFYNTAKGPSLAFSYTHTDGTTYSGVRFVNTSLTFERVRSKEWGVQVTIETATTVV